MKILTITAFVCLAIVSQKVFSGCPYFTKPMVESCGIVKSLNTHASGSHLCYSGTYYYCNVGQWINKGTCSNSGFVLPDASQKESSVYGQDECKSEQSRASSKTDQPKAGNGNSDSTRPSSGGFPSDGNFFENPDAAGWFEKENSQSAKMREKQRQEPSQHQYSGNQPDFESQMNEHERRASQAAQENYSEFSNQIAESTADAINSGIRSSINSRSSSRGSNPNCENAEGALLDLERYKIDLVEYIRVAPRAAKKEAMRRLNVAESGTDRLRAECF